MGITNEELEHRFNYHPPDSQEKAQVHESIRGVCRDAAHLLLALTGRPSREQSTAITKLEEAMFWANAAVARDVAIAESTDVIPGLEPAV